MNFYHYLILIQKLNDLFCFINSVSKFNLNSSCSVNNLDILYVNYQSLMFVISITVGANY